MFCVGCYTKVILEGNFLVCYCTSRKANQNGFIMEDIPFTWVDKEVDDDVASSNTENIPNQSLK